MSVVTTIGLVLTIKKTMVPTGFEPAGDSQKESLNIPKNLFLCNVKDLSSLFINIWKHLFEWLGGLPKLGLVRKINTFGEFRTSNTWKHKMESPNIKKQILMQNPKTLNEKISLHRTKTVRFHHKHDLCSWS